MDVDALLTWLAKHRETLTWLGGGAATLASGAWVVLRAWTERRGRDRGAAAPRSDPGASPGAGSAPSGDAATQRPAGLGDPRLSYAAFALAALGLGVVAIALLFGGDRIEVRNGAFVGGNMQGSTVTISPGPAGR